MSAGRHPGGRGWRVVEDADRDHLLPTSPTSPGSPSSPAGFGSNGAAAKACSPDSLKASAYQAADRPAYTGTGAAIVQFTNAGAKSCVLQGHPTVAGAANGSRNSMCR